MVESLEDYPYSSFPYYAFSDLIPPRFLDTTYLPNLLPYPFAPNKEGYLAFVLHRTFFAIEDGRYKEEVHSQALVPFKALVLRNRRIRGMRTMVPEDEKGQPVVDCPE